MDTLENSNTNPKVLELFQEGWIIVESDDFRWIKMQSGKLVYRVCNLQIKGEIYTFMHNKKDKMLEHVNTKKHKGTLESTTGGLEEMMQRMTLAAGNNITSNITSNNNVTREI